MKRQAEQRIKIRMIKYWMLIVAAATCMPLSGWSRLNQIARMESVYEEEREQIESQFMEERLNLPQYIITTLRDLELQASRDGNSSREEALLEVRRQFSLNPTAENLQSDQNLDVVQRLREHYEEAFQGATRTRQENLSVLTEQYRAALSRTQEELQRSGEDEALERVATLLAAVPEEQAPEPEPEPEDDPDDDLMLDLWDDDQPTTTAESTTDRQPEPASEQRSIPSRRESPGDDEFEALMDQWLEQAP